MVKRTAKGGLVVVNKRMRPAFQEPTCHLVNRYFSSASHFFKPPCGYFSDTLSKPALPAFIKGFVDPQHIATLMMMKALSENCRDVANAEIVYLEQIQSTGL